MTYSLCIQPTNPMVQRVIITCPTPDSNLIHRTRCAPWYYYRHKSYLPLACPDNKPQWSATLHISITGCPWCHYTAAGFSPLRLALSDLHPAFHLIGANIIPCPIPGARHSHVLPASFILIPALSTMQLPCSQCYYNVSHRQCFKLLFMIKLAAIQISFSSPPWNKSSLSNEGPTIIVLNVAMSLFQSKVVSSPRLWLQDPQSVSESSGPSTEPLLLFLSMSTVMWAEGAGNRKDTKSTMTRPY